MPEADTTASAAEGRVTDVDGRDVDDTLFNWLVFIALHMEAEGDFGDDDLLEDVLLALGYQDEQERERLQQPRQPHRLAFRDTLERLEVAGLVQQLPGPKARYRLAVAAVNDLQAVTKRIGTVWSDSGTEAIDSKAEIGWLVVTALRILDSSRVPHDDLDGKLAGLLGDRAEDVRNQALTAQLADLAAYDYVTDAAETSRLNKVVSIVAGHGWALTDHAWGGAHSLRDKLSSDFGHELRFDEGGSSADAHESSQAEDAQDTADGDAPEVQGLDDQAIGPLTDFGRRLGSANLTRESERREPSPDDPEIVSDLDLCVATLLALPRGADRENHPPRERDIIGEVASKLDIPGSWMRKNSAGPWVADGAWAKMVKRRKRVAHLLAYRMEHVFRALSIEQVGLIRDVAVNEGDVGRWALTQKGLAAVELGVLEQEDAGQVLSEKYSAIPEYFRMHSTTWRAEDAGWVREVLERFGDMSAIDPQPDVPKMEAREVRGRAFELLIRDLCAELDEVSGVEVQDSNEYLDRAGVDLVVKSDGAFMRERSTATLVQCKYNPRADVQADAASKLFATTVWLRTLSQRKEITYEVTGARVVFIGDLSREATWTFWALKAVWEPMTAAGREADTGSGDAESNGTTANLVWEVWDSWKVFQLMKEHEIGVRVDQISDGETVALDGEYFKELENRVGQRASVVATRNKGGAE